MGALDEEPKALPQDEYKHGYEDGLKEAEKNTVEVVVPPTERPIAVDPAPIRTPALDSAAAATSKIGAITDMLEAETPSPPMGVAEDEERLAQAEKMANEEDSATAAMGGSAANGGSTFYSA